MKNANDIPENDIYNDVINNLNHYMLTIKTLSAMNVYLEKPKNICTEENVPKQWEYTQKEQIMLAKEKDRFFTPKENDNLFWCYYIFVNGYTKYEMIDSINFINEKNTKMQYIEILRTNKKQLTPFRIRGLKDTVEDDLVNSRKISIKTFIALCIVSNLNVMFIHRRKYYEIKCDPDNANNIFVIHQFDNPTLKYSYEENVSPENIEKYRTELYNSHSINSPLKAISSYKVPELRDICKKLNIEDDIIKTKTKPQLYQLIIDTL